MKSIVTVFKRGFGPSSSHTIGPTIASKLFNRKYPDRDRSEVILYGSLALTGKGHGTDKAIKNFLPDAEVKFDINKEDLPHPNTMDLIAYKDGKIVGKETCLSIGGGEIKFIGDGYVDKEVYPENNLSQILKVCEDRNITLVDYIYEKEDSDFKEKLLRTWKTMEECIQRGLETEGVLPGPLNITRKAKLLYTSEIGNDGSAVKEDRLISAYAFAVSEENAAGNLVVTAPTCGSAGVLPAVLYYMRHDRGYSEDDIIDGLAVAGLIGNIIRTNASISGAECGCQAEVGSACSMAAAAKAQINKMSLRQIEYAAEVAMEHHLGLTCDPIQGYVLIPCIERNAVGAMRAMNSVNLARFLYQTRKISFDAVIETMYQTGRDLNDKYRETSKGGLASLY